VSVPRRVFVATLARGGVVGSSGVCSFFCCVYCWSCVRRLHVVDDIRVNACKGVSTLQMYALLRVRTRPCDICGVETNGL